MSVDLTKTIPLMMIVIVLIAHASGTIRMNQDVFIAENVQYFGEAAYSFRNNTEIQCLVHCLKIRLTDTCSAVTIFWDTAERRQGTCSVYKLSLLSTIKSELATTYKSEVQVATSRTNTLFDLFYYSN